MIALAAALALATTVLAAPLSSPSAPTVSFRPEGALARLDSLRLVVAAEEERVMASPRDELLWDRLARAWFQIGDHDRGRKAVEQARVLGAKHPQTLLLLGRVARSEWRLAEARDWLMRAARAKPDDWEVREDLGLTHYLAGDYAAAAEQWRRAAALPGSGSPDRSGLIAALRGVGARPYRITGRRSERLRFAHDSTSAVRRRLPLVAVSINGRGPFLLRIDTGSSEVVIGRSLARELKLASIVGGDAGVLPGGATATLDYSTLDSLTLGATTLHDLPCAVSHNPALGGESGVRGTLGFEVLRRFRFCLDYPDSALWLEPFGAATESVPGWVKLGDRAHRSPILVRGTHLVIAQGRLNAGPERPMVLDTGGPGIGFTAPASTLVESGVEVDTTRAFAGVGAGGPVAYFRIPGARVCVGSVCLDSLGGIYGLFPAPLEMSPNFRVAGIVSQGFLSYFRYGVDLSRREVWLVEPGVSR